jgi:hypothetical protein
MCTVTFVPIPNGCIFTSNRDEQTARKAAELPEAVSYPSGTILHPKDGLAGGTWVAQHSNGNIMVLLNGAFEKHIPSSPYRKSRGLVFLDIFDAATPTKAFQKIDLSNIEPFTLVIWQRNALYEARWDGRQKHLCTCDGGTPAIWSSVTLYDQEVALKRQAWFTDWLQTATVNSASITRRFHKFAGDGDKNSSLLMNREGLLQTVSITSIELVGSQSTFTYIDLLAGLTSVHEWSISNLSNYEGASAPHIPY